MSKDLVLPLIEASKLSLVGGKALSLGVLLRNGFKTVDGFVITTEAFDFMDEALQNEILKAFDSLGSTYVAVRSSAIGEDSKDAAWAGQLDTFLNVSRSELIDTIRKCWAAINSERARSYAKQKNIKLGKIAAIVQPMIQSDAVGVAFLAHPVTQDRSQIVIEAALGTGEAVVGGAITPDTYVVDKNNNEILEKYISKQSEKIIQKKSGKSAWQEIGNEGTKQKLADKKIQELSTTIVKLEKLYGFAVDVEWLIKDNELFIMQSRPITTLG